MKTQLAAMTAAALLFGGHTSIASNSFSEASQYLDLDGSMFGYVDFEGDGDSIGGKLNEVYAEMLQSEIGLPPIPLDFITLIDTLGFGSLRSMAFSSKQIEPGLYVNRAVTLLDGEPRGLMALYGLDPIAFKAADMAPAEATSAMSGRMDLTALRDMLVALATQVMGPMGQGMAEGYLGQPIPGTEITANEAIEALSGAYDFYLVQKMGEGMQMELKAWASIAGAGSLLERLRPLGEGMPIEFTDTPDGLRANLSGMTEGAPFGLFLEASKTSGALVIYTHEELSRAPAAKLSQSPAFQRVASRLPPGGAMYSYSVGFDPEQLLGALEQNPEMASYVPVVRKAVESLFGGLIGPNASALYKVDGALRMEQYAGYSFKELVFVAPAAVVGGIGAAAAISAAQAAHAAQQESGVWEVESNLWRISETAQAYLDSEEAESVSFAELAEWDDSLAEIESYLGETYADIVITPETEEIGVTLPDGRYISIELD